MSRRFIDDEIWDDPRFMQLDLQIKLLDRLMMEKLADKVGIVHLELGFAEYRLKAQLPNIDEIEKLLNPWWVRHGESTFLKKNFIITNQGKRLVLTDNAKVCVFEDLVKHKERGFDKVVSAVRIANPSLEVQTVKEAKIYIDELRAKYQDKRITKKWGSSSNVVAFEKCKNYFRSLGITDFPPINNGFKLDTDLEEELETKERFEQIKEEKEVLIADF